MNNKELSLKNNNIKKNSQNIKISIVGEGGFLVNMRKI